MSQHKACIVPQKQGQLEIGTRLTPTPWGKQALVKVTTAAINPADWKILISGLFVERFPAVLGTDGAGIIVEVGSEVDRFKVGDRIFFQGSYHHADETTFQQYCIVHTDIISKIPDNITEDQASSIPVGALTVLEVHPLGIFGIQLARIAGFSTIATTASPRHHNFLKSLGATHVFDRNISAKIIQSAFATPVSLVMDSISADSTQELAFDVLTTPSLIPGAHLSIVLPPADSIKDKNTDKKITVHQVYGSSHTFRDLSMPFWQNVGQWIKDGKFIPNRVQVINGGLAAIPGALDLSRKGVSGVKLVIHPQEEIVGWAH